MHTLITIDSQTPFDSLPEAVLAFTAAVLRVDNNRHPDNEMLQIEFVLADGVLSCCYARDTDAMIILQNCSREQFAEYGPKEYKMN